MNHEAQECFELDLKNKTKNKVSSNVAIVPQTTNYYYYHPGLPEPGSEKVKMTGSSNPATN